MNARKYPCANTSVNRRHGAAAWYPAGVRLAVWSLACAVAVAPTRTAAAEPAAEGAVLVAPLSLRGADAATSAENLSAALRAGVARAELPLVAADPTPCEDVACHVEAARRAGAAFVVVATVDVADRDYTVRVTLVDVDSGEAREVSDACAICGLDDAARITESLGARLGALWLAAREETAAKQQLARALQEQPRLRVTTRPPRAEVYVDGEKIGTTPVEHRVTPGRHLVEVRRVDYVGERREVDVARGSTGDVTIVLRPVGRLPATPQSRAALISGSVLLGVGAVGLGVMGYGVARGAALEREGADRVAMLEQEGVGGLELTDALADTRARGHQANVIAGVAGAVAGVLVITGATLVGVSATNRLRRVAAGPWGGRGLGGVTLSGRF